jgi:hypothetical protein
MIEWFIMVVLQQKRAAMKGTGGNLKPLAAD